MKFSLNMKRTRDITFYTPEMLKMLIVANGHKLVDNNDADIILVSLCDITELPYLEEIRKRFPQKIIAAGGHLGVLYKALLIFADMVNIGQGFDFFKCKNIEEIKALSCVATKEKKEKLIASTYIDWGKCPIVQISAKEAFYWVGTGCKNKCGFCLTSWTNKHQTNSINRVLTAENVCKKNKKLLNLISNEETGFGFINTTAKDFMLRQYLSEDNASRYVRVGLEFATEENRRKYGKPFTNEELRLAIRKANREKATLQLYAISGIDTKLEWNFFFEQLEDNYTFRPQIVFNFTSFEPQMFTPMRNKFLSLNGDDYLSMSDTRSIFRKHSTRIKNIKIFPPKYKEWVLYRYALSYSVNEREYVEAKKLKNNKDWEYGRNVIINKLRLHENDYTGTIDFGLAKVGES